MLRFTRAQRSLIADTLRQLANIIFGAAVVGQLIGAQRLSVLLAVGGITAWWILFLAGFAGGKDRE
jgi:hypothetical protein